jgi:hypothetical protein
MYRNKKDNKFIYTVKLVPAAVNNACDVFSESFWFKSLPGHNYVHLFFAVILCPCRQVSRSHAYLILGHFHFHPVGYLVTVLQLDAAFFLSMALPAHSGPSLLFNSVIIFHGRWDFLDE